jgi:excinuclease ABC subunit A
MIKPASVQAIELRGVRTHNLKNINLVLPHRKLIAVTGVSGSGKSSLVFDTLYAEGQRRYVESLSAYVRQFLERMEKPDLDSIRGILPAISIQSRNLISNARSTVGTQTEVNDFLRLLFSRIGKVYCTKCGERVQKDSPAMIFESLQSFSPEQNILVLFSVTLGKKGKKYATLYLDELIKQGFHRVLLGDQVVDLEDEKIRKEVAQEETILVVMDRLEAGAPRTRWIDSVESAYRYGKGVLSLFLVDMRKILVFSDRFHCAPCNIDFQEPTQHLFSFNSPIGACPECQGFGRVIEIDPDLVIPDTEKTLEQGAVEPWTKPSREWEFDQLKTYCRKKHIPLDVPYRKLTAEQKKMVWQSEEGYVGIEEFFKYLEKKTYRVHVRVFLSRYRSYVTCPRCNGSRLKSEALLVRVGDKNIEELSRFTIEELISFFSQNKFTDFEEELVRPVLLEIRNRLRFLREVGLGYLTLDRLSRTLSGGEAQRIHLASSLGSNLVDTLYVLDEPSIGLHERDNQLLIGILKRLRDLGNTVIVVEHDRTMMEAADQLIDIGPNAGDKGGEILFQGTPRELEKVACSLTARYLRGQEKIELQRDRSTIRAIDQAISIRGAQAHNLKSIDVEIPLGKFVVLTGVSGSGKSTLLYEVLYKNYLRHTGQAVSEVGQVQKVEGFHRINDMNLVDQSPIGRTPRSNPITYIKAFDEIRKAFASTKEAKIRGLEVKDFSFNVEGGRCNKCEGDGQIKVEMHFLADLFVTCEECNGQRYQKRILEVRYKGKNIHDVLNMPIESAITFFNQLPNLIKKLQVLQGLGLGYLKLGQPAPTLSQGEAQRLKLAIEMMEPNKERIFYLFDEPTTGLHYYDIHFLMRAFADLLERGHSILVIEHNMEIIKCAEHVIDLGPDGGDKGGQVVFSGSVPDLMKQSHSYTGQYLKKYLKKQTPLKSA